MSLDEKQKDKTELKVDPKEEPSDASLGGPAVETEPQTDAEESKTVEELPNFGENYEPIEVIGQGGMGAVYKVKERSSGTTFAVKLLQNSFSEDPAALKRFEQEVNSASKLTHPNLVAVYGHGKTPAGAPYLVMDYLEGQSLSDVIEKEGRLEPRRALDIFIQIAEALKHAHDKGVIHRDVKPTNVILSKTSSGDDIVKIVDFGIAKVLPATSRETRDLTQTGEVFGSPHYMSPEQCLGFMLDQRSDIYSFGCLMYEVITGEPPFGGSNPIQLVVKHINESPPNFQKELKTNKQIKLLESVVLKCLDKEQNERFQTVDDLKRDLESIRADKPIAKYVTKRAKPTLTRQQLIGGVAVSFLLFYYAATAGSALNPQATPMIMGGMLTLLACAGAYIFLKSGVARLLNAYRRRETPGRWWVALILTSLGMGALSFIPWTVRLAFFDYSNQPPLEVDALVTLGTLFHEIFLFVGIVSGIGFAVTRSARRVGAAFIALWFVGISTAIISWSLILIPDRVSAIPLSIASTLTTHMPELALPLHKCAAALDSDNRTRWWEVEYLQERMNQLTDALETLRRLPEELLVNDVRDTRVRANQIELLIKLGRFNDALKIIRSIKGNEYDDSQMLSDWYAAQGKFDQALKVLEQFENKTGLTLTGLRTKQPVNVPVNFPASKKIDLYMALGQYQKAYDLFMKEPPSSENSSSQLLRATILQKLGRNEEAAKCCRLVLKSLQKFIEEPTNTRHYGRTESLFVAYAYAMLGDMEKAQEFLAHYYRSDFRYLFEEQKYYGKSVAEAMRKRLSELIGLKYGKDVISFPKSFSP